MDKIGFSVFGYFVIWAVFFGIFWLAVAEGFFSRPRKRSDVYLIWGALFGIATCVLVYVVNHQIEQIAEGIRNEYLRMFIDHARNNTLGPIVQRQLDESLAARLYPIIRFKDFFTLLVSIFGVGVSGNVIVLAISERRRERDSSLRSS